MTPQEILEFSDVHLGNDPIEKQKKSLSQGTSYSLYVRSIYVLGPEII